MTVLLNSNSHNSNVHRYLALTAPLCLAKTPSNPKVRRSQAVAWLFQIIRSALPTLPPLCLQSEEQLLTLVKEDLATALGKEWVGSCIEDCQLDLRLEEASTDPLARGGKEASTTCYRHRGVFIAWIAYGTTKGRPTVRLCPL